MVLVSGLVRTHTYMYARDDLLALASRPLALSLSFFFTSSFFGQRRYDTIPSAMSTISSFKAKSVEATDAILKSGPDTIATIENVIATNYAHGGDLSAVEAAMKADLEANG